MYFIVYHSQSNEQSKRTNQTIEIAFRFYMSTIFDSKKWFNVLKTIQRLFNNVVIVNIERIFNEINFEFNSLQVVDLRKSFANRFFFVVDRFFQSQLIRTKIVDLIAFAQMSVKYHYDRKHQFLFMKKNDYTLIRLHRDYKISIIDVLDKKYNQQFVKFFKILEKIERLIYRLNLFSHWRIHSILNIVQLKFSLSSLNDSYRRHRINNFDSIFVENDIFTMKFFEIERLLNKREIKKRESKYLIRWKNCESKKNVWKNLFELNDAMNLIRQYENVLNVVTFTISSRLQKLVINSSSKRLKKFVVVSKFDVISNE